MGSVCPSRLGNGAEAGGNSEAHRSQLLRECPLPSADGGGRGFPPTGQRSSTSRAWEPGSICRRSSPTCGLRRGEVLSLRWSDIDLDRAVLVARHAVELLNGQSSLNPPKTHQAAAVSIPASVVEDLRLARAAAPQGDGYIVSEPDGSLARPDLLTGRFRRHALRLGLDISSHGLRHTQGTLLLAGGVPERIAIARMRHRTPKMLHHFSHVLPDVRDDAAARVNGALGRRSGKPAEE